MVWGRQTRLSLLYRTVPVETGGAIILPEQLQRRLGSDPVLAPSIDRCLAVYPSDVWTQLVSRLQSLPDLRPEITALLESLTASACPASMDDRGEIRVPATLRRLAGIDGEALPVARPDHAELWDPRAWSESRSRRRGAVLNHGAA